VKTPAQWSRWTSVRGLPRRELALAAALTALAVVTMALVTAGRPMPSWVAWCWPAVSVCLTVELVLRRRDLRELIAIIITGAEINATTARIIETELGLTDETRAGGDGLPIRES
jgi:hypothetical protein